jgi:hypothetical protein
MQEASFARRRTLVTRFTGERRSGRIRTFYGTTRRSADSGFPALQGFPSAGAVIGFPVIKCEVECDQPGYWSCLGWIQWVTQEFGGRRPRVALVDRFPSILDRDVPFLGSGYAPTFFDAPAFNSLPKVDWRASLFLCTLPLMGRREPVVPLAGFLWGYRIATAGGAVEPYPCRAATARDWAKVRPELKARHPAWRFGAWKGRRGTFKAATAARPG